ncbi:MAG: hypothetical protein WC662_03950 [Candidatus Paceibacterota bacterium]|jgi:hypothetical protein
MKKLVLFMIVVVMTIGISLPVLAQNVEPELQMKVLTEKPYKKGQKVKILIFSSIATTITKDSVLVGENKIIHFKPLEVVIDSIHDTISISSSFVDNQTQIMTAYRWPGFPAFLVNNSESYKRSWKSLSFWTEEEIKTDTTKFVYDKSSREVNVWQEKEDFVIGHPYYALIVVCIIFLLGILIDFIFFKEIWYFILGKYKEKKVINKVASTNNNDVTFIEFFSVLSIMVWVISIFWIILTKSFVILLAILVSAIVAKIIINNYKKKKKNVKK